MITSRSKHKAAICLSMRIEGVSVSDHMVLRPRNIVTDAYRTKSFADNMTYQHALLTLAAICPSMISISRAAGEGRVAS